MDLSFLVFYLYLAAGAVGLALIGLCFLRAVGSRKSYSCRHCGEKVRVELMDALHCNHCGAPLNRAEEHHA